MKKAKKQDGIWIVIGVVLLAVIASCASPEGSISATPIHTPLQTSSPTSTQTITSTSDIPNATSTPKPIIVYESTSPNSRWSAITSREVVNGQERSIFRVSNDDGRISWEVENEIYAENPPSGFWFPVPFYWSKDGKYLYFAHNASGDGCFGGNKHLGKNVERLDLTTGEVSHVSEGGTYLAISPDEKYLAFIPFGDESINIQSLTNGKVDKLELLVRHEDLGIETDQRYITWSPDSKSLVFVIMAGVCDFTVESYFNWVVPVDLSPLSQRMLTEKDEQGLVPISWIAQDKILTRDKDGKIWWMNPNTGETSPIQ
jgi:hypothetical protein